ncbi:hypothetical protein HanIR_Chr16g0788011 [Helianthus annuus]|nr:hypothetical protein HanIR_Chr16g0788011 [Helianthus annuus]
MSSTVFQILLLCNRQLKTFSNNYTWMLLHQKHPTPSLTNKSTLKTNRQIPAILQRRDTGNDRHVRHLLYSCQVGKKRSCSPQCSKPHCQQKYFLRNLCN